MDRLQLGSEARAALAEMLAYLNLSSGKPDPRFESNVNLVFEAVETQVTALESAWREFAALLAAELVELQGSRDALREIDQAQAVLRLTFEQVLPAYRRHHRDLLHHQSEASLFRPYFLARALEAVLRQGTGGEPKQAVAGVLKQLNDFIGHRPVAVLRTSQRIEPYAHEWVCPVPLYLRGAGVACGKYHDVVEQALKILESTDETLLERAAFDLELLDELAFDARAYDFDHPVNKRPNYQFGQWDPHRLDNAGRYRRFVTQEVTLEALYHRTANPGDLPREEVLFEAAAVLAGTILMAAGVSGRGPETHDSGTTLFTLLPQIASYRDAFYEQLLAKVPGSHGERLRSEAATLRQPFGGARQHLNGRLARLRATQLQHVHLAQLFARMGYAEASKRQARIVPVTSARLLCEINGRVTAGQHAIDRGQLPEAGMLLPEIRDVLERAIQCGALVDPWNMLGFQGQFSLFPALENSVHDHRVDVLVHLVQQVFGLSARLQGEAAAAGHTELAERVANQLGELATWWDRFASTEVSGIEGFSGRETAASAAHVAQALASWKRAGARAGNIAFWREQVTEFDSPKAYALVVEALLEQRDFVAGMALLMQWVARSAEVPLAEEDYSFHDLALRWMTDWTQVSSVSRDGPPKLDADTWKLLRKFFDFLEANAEEYWEVPAFAWEQGEAARGGKRSSEDDDDPDGSDELFGAAYEEMTYRDSTGDGVEGDTLEGGSQPNDYELDFEARRIGQRLAFLTTLARLWQLGAVAAVGVEEAGERDATLAPWFARARDNRQQLLALLSVIEAHRIPEPNGTQESLVEYDRRRQLKEMLLGRTIATCVEMADAARLILAACESLEGGDDLADWERQAVVAVRAVFRGRPQDVQSAFPPLRVALEQQPILYVSLAKNGDPRSIVLARSVQQVIADLLRWLPRLGLLGETCQLIATAQTMEKNRPPGEGMVTEFDRLFELGCRALVEALVSIADDNATSPAASAGDGDPHDLELVDVLHWLTGSLSKRWLLQSRSLRLSVLEKVHEKERWKSLVKFVESYGHDLFTQRFLNPGNLRAILHQGVDVWLRRLQAEPDAENEFKLLSAIGEQIPLAEAAEQVALVIEAVLENYGEYKDFNTTTTQSDRGELLFMLLDFLRLKTSYERLAWNIKPVVLAHEVLVRRGRLAAAETWRRSLAERTSEVASWHLKQAADLTRKYGLRLTTVLDRLEERLVRPLAVDRMRALVGPAIEAARRGENPQAFVVLEQELDDFTTQPSGSGLDVPAWLIALEQEVGSNCGHAARRGPEAAIDSRIARVSLTWDEVQEQLRSWESGL